MAALILVTACQGGGDDASPGGDGESPGAGGGTEIDEASISGEVRLSGGRSSDAEEALLEETLAAFSEAYPDIEVIYEPIPEAYVENMIGQFSAGDPPDLFYVGATGEAAPWIEDELLLPLDDYIDGNPEIGLEHFYPGLLAPFQRDGSTYGLPKDASPLALFVNPDMLADAGVEIPDQLGRARGRGRGSDQRRRDGTVPRRGDPALGCVHLPERGSHLQRRHERDDARLAGDGRGARLPARPA